MIDPNDMLRRQPPIQSLPGLYKNTGLYAVAHGILRPRVLVDRTGEHLPGFEALMFHEALHVHERHALVGFLFLLVPVVGWGLWVWWRRAQEIRADLFALRAAGSRDFYAFVAMHPHPRGRFWRWCYGATAAARFNRTVARYKRSKA